ncbi:MAG: heavy metal translocating P-type ATPase [Burkholderiales bacterium]
MAGCFHCGQEFPAGSAIFAHISGRSHAVCCAGCRAVAEMISSAGLGAYYDTRTSLPATPVTEGEGYAIYDRPEVQTEFVRRLSEHERETTLLLEGISCSACLWLNERHLSALEGVTGAEVNYATRRARVRWDERRIKLSSILAAVQAIGYRAFPSTQRAADELRLRERRTSLWRLAVAGLGMMQVMMYAVPAYLAGDGSMGADIEGLMRWASLLLTLPVLLYSCAPFFQGAWRDLRNGTLGMDVPVALGILVAFVASAAATLRGFGEVYFDSIAMFAFLLLLARYIEQEARQKAARGLEYVARALPVSAHRLPRFPLNEEQEDVPAVSLTAGDVVLVKAGENVPADGSVLRGETQVDESLLTGESRPVRRAPGMAVVAGAINRHSPFLLQVERAGDQTRASHIARLMERAAAERPRIIHMADRAAAYFVLAVLVIAGAAAIGWYFIDPSKALSVTVAVLVVTCPCALSLAAPAVLAAATASLAKRGMIVTSARAIESLARINHIVFDKTGTLTDGQLALVRVVPSAGCTEEQALQLAAALERHSEHPIGSALVTAAGNAELPLAVFSRNLPGSGVEASIGNARYRLGRKRWVCETHEQAFSGEGNEDSGSLTQVWLGNGQRLLARFDLADNLRAGAREAVSSFLAQGLGVSLWSGDAQSAVRHAASRLGIEDYAAELVPEEKLRRMQMLQARGAVVAMVGDGINDAPVLAQAHLSVAMGSGAVLAQAHSDVVLTSSNIGALGEGHETARRAMRILRQNLAWALAYNVVALPLAIGGWLTPWIAGAGMAASSLVVMLNSLRLWPREHRHAGPIAAAPGPQPPAPSP